MARNVTHLVPDRGTDSFTTGTATTTAGAKLAANSDRSYLLIQNKSATETIYARTDGTDATAANGIKIGPGGAYERTGVSRVPTGAVNLVATGNADFLIVEA
jgi:hypothetical protein